MVTIFCNPHAHNLKRVLQVGAPARLRKPCGYHDSSMLMRAQRDPWHARCIDAPSSHAHQPAAAEQQASGYEQLTAAPFAAVSNQHRVRESTASISRAAASPQGASGLRSMLSSRIVGPASVALVAGYCGSLLIAAWRFFIINRTRACSTCHGYGLTRCDFCQGAGQVQWEGKWGHVDPVRIPLCVHMLRVADHAGAIAGAQSV